MVPSRAIIIYSLAFINYAIVGTVLLITGRKIDNGNFVSKYEFWSQVLFFAVGCVTAILVFTHDITAFNLQSRQLTVGESYQKVCVTANYPCFSSPIKLCDFLRADDSLPWNDSTDPGTSASELCSPSSDFIIDECHIFGQSEVTAAEVISFGQYRFGGYGCSDHFCPHSDSRDTEVRMASKAMWRPSRKVRSSVWA